MDLLALGRMRDRDKLLCSGRELIESSYTLNFSLCRCTLYSEPVCQAGSVHWLTMARMGAAEPARCPGSSLLCTFLALLEGDSTSSLEQSKSEQETAQDVFREQLSVAPATEATRLLDLAGSAPGLPGRGQTRLGFTHIHRWR